MSATAWSLLVGVAGFALAAVVFGWQIATARRQEDLQRRVVVIEEARREEEIASRKRADITVHLDCLEKTVVLTNRGQARATGVYLTLQPPVGGEHIVRLIEQDQLPLNSLEPNAHFALHYVGSSQLGPPFSSRWYWSDEIGQSHREALISC